jgi:hypothetical protein
MELMSALSQTLLWLWPGNSLGHQEGECPPLEVGTRGLVKEQQTIKI